MANEIENNGNTSNANLISEGTTYFGQIASGDDRDFYYLPISRTGVLKLNLQMPDYSSSYPRFDVEIIDSYGNKLVDFNPYYNDTLYANIQNPGNYYIRIKSGDNYYSPVTYSFSAKMDYGTNYAEIEIGQNGDINPTSLIDFGVETFGQIKDTRDVDFFGFFLKEGGNLNIFFSEYDNSLFTNSSDPSNLLYTWSVTLYSATTDLKKILQYKAATNGDLEFSNLEPNTYIIAVTYADSYNRSTYSLNLSKTPLTQEQIILQNTNVVDIDKGAYEGTSKDDRFIIDVKFDGQDIIGLDKSVSIGGFDKENDTIVFRGENPPSNLSYLDLLSSETIDIVELHTGGDNYGTFILLSPDDNSFSKSIFIKNYLDRDLLDISIEFEEGNKNITENKGEGDVSIPLLNFSSGSDIIVPTNYAIFRGLGGNDTYILTNAINNFLSIADSSGNNTIQLVDGFKVNFSTYSINSLTLFTDEGVVNIYSADDFIYEIGGNVTAGVTGRSLTFDQFIKEFNLELIEKPNYPVQGPDGVVYKDILNPYLSPLIDENKKILESFNDSVTSGTRNYSNSNDVITLTGSGNTERGLGGDDVYLISNLMPTNSKISIVDTSGLNKIQIPDGTFIDKTLFTNNAVRLTLDDSRVVTINGADKFIYNLGANVTSGDTNKDLSFTEFASWFGVDDILNSSGSFDGPIIDVYVL